MTATKAADARDATGPIKLTRPIAGSAGLEIS